LKGIKPVTYKFGTYTLDPGRFELTHGNDVVPTEPQVFALLEFLIRNCDRVVSKDDMIMAIWEGRIVSDATLSSRISAARQAVGDSGSKQQVIRTVSRRGFQFIAPVESLIPSATTSSRPEGDAPQIRYCTTPDGIDLPFSFSGQGPTLIKVANWLNHLERDWTSPMWAPFFKAFSAEHTFIRYDSRGVGLSNWGVGQFCFEDFVTDLATVIEASGQDTFALLGLSQGAAVAIDYAVRNPDRVTHLILWGGFARGRRMRGNEENRTESEAFITLMRQGWGKEKSAFRDMFASLYLPEASDEQISWWIDMQRTATSPDTAVLMREVIDGLDVSQLLEKVRVPTLILHSERDLVAPVSEARFMAARIPDAKFVSLDSANHLVMNQEDAWSRARQEVQRFLNSSGGEKA